MKLTVKEEAKVEKRGPVAQRQATGHWNSEAGRRGGRGRGGLCVRLRFVFCHTLFFFCMHINNIYDRAPLVQW